MQMYLEEAYAKRNQCTVDSSNVLVKQKRRRVPRLLRQPALVHVTPCL